MLVPEQNLLFQLFNLPIQFFQVRGKPLQQVAEAAGQLPGNCPVEASDNTASRGPM